jgi:uncharacterized protein (UPF0332 family)
VKEFKTYLSLNDVRKQSPDPHTATATLRTARERLQLAREIKIPKFAIENAYEALIEAINAIMYAHGYKSYTHEATISYLQEFEFSEGDIGRLDKLRKQRHGIKYYGDDATAIEAAKAITFADALLPRIESQWRR